MGIAPIAVYLGSNRTLGSFASDRGLGGVNNVIGALWLHSPMLDKSNWGALKGLRTSVTTS